jgi:predicted SAM-dependent methyltransferase
MTLRLLNLGCGDRYHPDWVNVDFHSSNPAVLAHDLKDKLPFEEDFFDVVYHSHVQEHLPKIYVPMFFHECFRVLKPGGIIRLVIPDLEQIARIYLELLERALQNDKVAQERYDWIMLEMLDQIARNQSGGEMLKYWMQNPMPAEDYVIARVGSEVVTVINQLRNPTGDKGSGERPPYYEEDYETIGKFRLSGEVHQWMYDRYSLKMLLTSAGFDDAKQCRADESAIQGFNDYFLDGERDGSVRKPDSLFMEAIKPLQESNSDRAARIEAIQRLDAQLKEYKAGRGIKKGLAAQLEARLKESEADRSALDAQLKKSEADRSALDAQLKAAYDELHELRQAQQELFQVKSSRSWKLTAPLRWFSTHLLGRK